MPIETVMFIRETTMETGSRNRIKARFQRASLQPGRVKGQAQDRAVSVKTRVSSINHIRTAAEATRMPAGPDPTVTAGEEQEEQKGDRIILWIQSGC
jgi:hypothetical protein